MKLRQHEMTTLEAMIDSSNLATVLEALAEVAQGKADHLRTNWQSPTDAQLWDEASAALGALAGRASIINVSI